MSPEAQRIAIAESCGWGWRRYEGGAGSLHFGWFSPHDDKVHAHSYKREGKQDSIECLPNYLSDLNAMHEAETWLLTNKPDLRPVYRRILIDCSEKSHHYWRATAVQRAEAYLRALNLWQKSQPPTP